jgi:DNA-binding NarL/FixJ family response regulator
VRAAGASGRSEEAYRQPSMRVSRFVSGLPKVVVLHDHEVVAEVLKILLTDRIDLVAETYSGNAAVSLSELLVPDVVVTGEVLVDGMVEHYVPALLQTGARVLTIYDSFRATRLLDLVELGVTGLIGPGDSPFDMAEAILELARGGAVVPPQVTALIVADWRRTRRRGTSDFHGGMLTARELEVLGAMSDGLSTKAVAHHLGIALKTVENHKTRIFEKLGVRTQAQAVAMAVGAGSGLTYFAQTNISR